MTKPKNARPASAPRLLDTARLSSVTGGLLFTVPAGSFCDDMSIELRKRALEVH